MDETLRKKGHAPRTGPSRNTLAERSEASTVWSGSARPALTCRNTSDVFPEQTMGAKKHRDNSVAAVPSLSLANPVGLLEFIVRIDHGGSYFSDSLAGTFTVQMYQNYC